MNAIEERAPASHGPQNKIQRDQNQEWDYWLTLDKEEDHQVKPSSSDQKTVYDTQRVINSEGVRDVEQMIEKDFAQQIEIDFEKSSVMSQGSKVSVQSESAGHNNLNDARLSSSLGKTFALVHGKKIFISDNSLFFLKNQHCLRQALIRFITWKWFEYFIIGIIFLNTLCLILYNYDPNETNNKMNQVLDIVNQVFTILFFVEALIKILAMGFLFHPHSYLRDFWNTLDFIIVVSGMLELFASFLPFKTNLNLKSLRNLRVLRPLRSINTIPRMKQLVKTLINSLPQLLNVVLFLSFVFSLFGILGVQQYSGYSYYFCRTTPEPITMISHKTNQTIKYWPKDHLQTRLCSIDGLGSYQCLNGTYCGGDLEKYGMTPSDDGASSNLNIQYGLANFDNIYQSIIAVFQIITRDAWSGVLYNVRMCNQRIQLMDSTLKEVAAIYCVTIVIIGSFFLMNLILAVMMDSFKEMESTENLKELEEAVQSPAEEAFKLKPMANILQEPLQNNENEDEFIFKDIPDEGTFVQKQEQMNEEVKESFDDEFDYKVSEVDLPKLKLDHKISYLNSPMPEINQIPGFSQPEFNLEEEGNKKQEEVIEEKPNLFAELRRQIKILKEQKLAESKKNQLATDVHASLFDKSPLNTDQQNSHRSSSHSKRELCSPKLNEPQQAQPPGKNLLAAALFGKLMLGKKTSQEDQKNSNLQNLKQRYEDAVKIESIEERMAVHSNLKVETAQVLSDLQKAINKKQMERKLEIYGLGSGQETNMVLQIQSKIEGKLKQKQRKTKLNVESHQSAVESISQNEDQESQSNQEDGVGDIVEEDENLEIAIEIQKEIKEAFIRKQIFEGIFHKIKDILIRKNDIIEVLEQADDALSKDILLKRAKKNKVYKLAFHICSHPVFNFAMTFIIIFNTSVLALDNYKTSHSRTVFTQITNYIFFAVYILEMLIKLTGLGFKFYFKDNYNTFDFFIVLFSTIDVILSQSNLINITGSKAVQTLRAVRIIRVFKLVKSWKTLQSQLRTIGNTLRDISTFSVLLLLFMIIFSLLGMEWFAYRVRFNEFNELDLNTRQPYPNGNFNTFFIALLTIFVILTGDSWTTVYYQHYRAVGGALSSTFFLSLVIVGQYVLLLLFVAILVEHFDEASLDQEIKKSSLNYSQFQQKKVIYKIFNFIKRKLCCRKIEIQDIRMDLKNEETKKEEEEKKQEEIENEQQVNYSLYYFSSKSNFRIVLSRIISSQKFDYFILFLILASSIQLVLENPLYNPKGQLSKILFYMDITFTTIFSLEAFFKIFTYGLILNGPDSYLKSGWNALDITIIFFSVLSFYNIQIVSLSIPGVHLAVFKVLRLLRVLRPLRFISKNQGLKVAISALIKGIPQIFNVIMIALLFLLIFSIMGVNFYKGLFYYCSYSHLSGVTYSSSLQFTITDKWNCLEYGGEWLRQDRNYDDVLNSLISSFMISQTFDWSKVMYQGMSIVGENKQPQPNSSQLNALYFVMLIIVTNFFITNLFVGVVVSTFNREKENLGTSKQYYLLTSDQKKWLETKLLLLDAKPKYYLKEPKWKWRKYFYFLSKHRYFERFIFVCIVCNTLLLAIIWYQQPHLVSSITDILQYIFTVIFTLEVIIKMIAFGFRYFYDQWYIFDLLVVLGTNIGTLLQIITKANAFSSATVLRAFRIARILKLFRKQKSLNIIFETFIVILPSLLNVGGLLSLLVFIYSVLGINIFSTVKWHDVIFNNLNFESMGVSALTLLVMATGDNFNSIMQDIGRKPSIMFKCKNYPSYQDYADNGYSTLGCGSRNSSIIFCFSFIVIIILIFLNLFIAIIVDGYRSTTERNQKMFNSELKEQFRNAWSLYDQDATSLMQIGDFKAFMFELGGSFGWDHTFKNNLKKQEQYLKQMTLATHKNGTCYSFVDVFETLALIYVVNLEIKKYIKVKEEDSEKLRAEIEENLRYVEENQDNVLSKAVASKRLKVRKIQKKYSQEEVEADLKLGIQNLAHQHMGSTNFNQMSSAGNLLSQMQTTKQNDLPSSSMQAKRDAIMLARSFLVENIDDDQSRQNSNQLELTIKKQKSNLLSEQHFRGQEESKEALSMTIAQFQSPILTQRLEYEKVNKTPARETSAWNEKEVYVDEFLEEEDIHF